MPDAAPRFRRPTPGDAVDVARELLDEDERVDVQAVARRLGVSRATMHRWFGTRDQLMAALFAQMAQEFVAEALASARGRGDARAFDFVRRLADRAAAVTPLQRAATEDPALVMRIVLAPDGPVRGPIVETVTQLLAATRTPAQLRRIRAPVGLFVDAALALHWGTVMSGQTPDGRRYALLGRALLAQAEGAAA